MASQSAQLRDAGRDMCQQELSAAAAVAAAAMPADARERLQGARFSQLPLPLQRELHAALSPGVARFVTDCRFVTE